MGRFIGAIGVMGVIGGAWLLLVFLGVVDSNEEGRASTLLLGLAALAVGIPALVYRIRDILS